MSQKFEFSIAESLHSRLKPRSDQQREEDISKLAEVLSGKSRYWMIDEGKLIYDSRTQLLWDSRPKLEVFPDDQSDPEAFKTNLLQRNVAGFQKFRLPTKDELIEVAKNDFPLREGRNARIKDHNYWLVQGGVINLDNSDPHIETSWGSVARVISVASAVSAASAASAGSVVAFLGDLLAKAASSFKGV